MEEDERKKNAHVVWYFLVWNGLVRSNRVKKTLLFQFDDSDTMVFNRVECRASTNYNNNGVDKLSRC